MPALVEAVTAALGPIEILVTNTGGPPASPDPLAQPREEWEQAYRTLVLAPLELIRAVLPAMRERGFGRIVNIGSLTVREPMPDLMLSNSHRSATLAAFKTIARDVAGVRRHAQHGAARPDRHRPALRAERRARAGRGAATQPRCRPAGSARPRSWRPRWRSSARRALATSPARRCSSTAAFKTHLMGPSRAQEDRPAHRG